MPPLPSPPQERERQLYYYGLESGPTLVARSSTFIWKEKILDAHSVKKQLKVIGKHPISGQWDRLAQTIITILDSKAIKWSSIDAVRIGYDNEYAFPIVWIGVQPKSLGGEDGLQIALQSKQLLDNDGLYDVHCEIREAERLGYAGPKLMKSVLYSNPTADIQVSLTATLGTSISTKNHPYVEGTMGFYVSNEDKLFGVTTRHVIFPRRMENQKYEFKSARQPRYAVMLPGNGTWTRLKAGAEDGRDEMRAIMEFSQRRIQALGGQEGDDTAQELKEAKEAHENAEKGITRFEDLIMELDAWKTQDSREVGKVFISPSIGADLATGYTIDWCLYEINASKIDLTNFRGNVIDLGTKIRPEKMTRMLNPNIQNRHKFCYPTDRLLSLRGILPISEMTQPKMLDKDGNPCILVLKRGMQTGVTVGIANQILSYSRSYFDDGTRIVAKEWAILSYSKKMAPFSEPGDSGALIVDATGQLGGLLTGGSGLTDTSDITYATPLEFLLAHMEKIAKRKFKVI